MNGRQAKEILEALDILEKGCALTAEICRKKENNEEVPLEDMKELLRLTVRRDEIMEKVEYELKELKALKNEEIKKVGLNS